MKGTGSARRAGLAAGALLEMFGAGLAAGPRWSAAAHAQAGGGGSSPYGAILAPGTVTVEGIGQTRAKQYVTQVSDNFNVNGLTVSAVLRDESKAAAALKARMEGLGIPAGDVSVQPGGVNDNNGGPSGSVSVNIVLAQPAKWPKVMASLYAYSPSFASNNFTNVQTTALNPGAERARLYAMALRDARAQAEELAAGSGKTVGPVVSMSTVNPQAYAQSMQGPYPTSPNVGGVQPVYNGNGQNPPPELQSQVIVTFALLPAPVSQGR